MIMILSRTGCCTSRTGSCSWRRWCCSKLSNSSSIVSSSTDLIRFSSSYSPSPYSSFSYSPYSSFSSSISSSSSSSSPSSCFPSLLHPSPPLPSPHLPSPRLSTSVTSILSIAANSWLCKRLGRHIMFAITTFPHDLEPDFDNGCWIVNFYTTWHSVLQFHGFRLFVCMQDMTHHLIRVDLFFHNDFVRDGRSGYRGRTIEYGCSRLLFVSPKDNPINTKYYN